MAFHRFFKFLAQSQKSVVAQWSEGRVNEATGLGVALPCSRSGSVTFRKTRRDSFSATLKHSLAGTGFFHAVL